VDTPENRDKAAKLANLVAAYKAEHDPLELLEGSRTEDEVAVGGAGPTVAEYYEEWIVRKTPPLTRKAQARDYRKHISGYVLPGLGSIPLADVQPRMCSTSRPNCSSGDCPSSTPKTFSREVSVR
jgi:hypothetical protein